MKLLTYFRAMEIAVDKTNMYIRINGVAGASRFMKRKYSQSLHLRDGLIKRMERVENKLADARNLLPRDWDWDDEEALQEPPSDLLTDEQSKGLLTDGFGNYWSKTCPDCGAPMRVVRPGDARCSAECHLIDDRIKEATDEHMRDV